MLNLSTYLIKERVGMLKFTDRYDIFDPQNGQMIGFAQETVSPLMLVLRLVVSKQLLPSTVVVREQESGPVVFSIKRGPVFFRSKVQVLDAGGQPLGYFKSKFLSLGGGFFVFDNKDAQVAEIKGDWKGWNFKLLDTSGKELGTVAKKWAGLAKEMFTSADNYVVALSDEVKANPGVATLLLAAGLAIDCVYGERGG